MLLRHRRLVIGLTVAAAVGAAVLVATLWFSFARTPQTIDDTCRSLAPGHEFVGVPGDVLNQSARVSGVQLQDLARPSTRQAEVARQALVRGADPVPRDPTWVNAYAACLVDYSRSGRAGDASADPPVAAVVERDHVAALLLYRKREAPVDPCFGPEGACEGGSTYPIDCALFVEADTGRLLRVEGCWGFRDDAD